MQYLAARGAISQALSTNPSMPYAREPEVPVASSVKLVTRITYAHPRDGVIRTVMMPPQEGNNEEISPEDRFGWR